MAFIAREAKLGDEGYEVRPVPEPKNFLEQLMEQSSSGDKDNHNLVNLRTGGPSSSILQLALPYLQDLDPQRVGIVKQALLRLDLIQKEGVILMMPEVAMP